MTAAAEAHLSVLAAWDVPRVRSAVGTLGAVNERLPSWRMRVAEVARTLDAPGFWSGPAARSAARAVLDVSAVATAVAAALAVSRDAFDLLAGEADAAQNRAVEALALTHAREADVFRAPAHPGGSHAGLSVLFPGTGPPDPAPAAAAAEAALAHAAAVAAAADAAGSALAGLGVRDAFAPSNFPELAGWIAPVDPVVPHGADPSRVAAWWAGLSAGAQLSVLRSRPAAIGGLDGVPAWARDRANRRVLDRARRHGGTSTAARTARAVAQRLAVEEAAGRPVQLHRLDLEAEQVVLVLGDLDTAEVVGLLVPGILTSPEDLPRLVGNAREVVAAAGAAGPLLEVAGVVWLGYAAPDTPREVLTRSAAADGGRNLATTLDGMRAAREAAAHPQPRTTVVAHSYGTVVVDEAADASGRLAADAVVLLGSPGMEEQGARSLEVAEVYDAWSPMDVVSYVGHFGDSTWKPWYGSTGLPGSPRMTHSDYYDPGFPTLGAIGEVLVGAD